MSDRRHTLITGASRGLGRALAEHLLAVGDVVLGCARGSGTIDHDRYVHVEADVTNEADVDRVLARAREIGRLDILINNAGTAKMLPLALTPDHTVRHIIDLNLLAVVRLIHRAVRLMRKSTAARIINMSSVAVPLRLEGESVYAASKAAIETLTRIVAKELGPLGITCNAIGPTPIRTDLIRNVPEEKLAAIVRQQAIPIWAEPSDVANVVDFFLRPESRLITGQVLYLGGMG